MPRTAFFLFLLACQLCCRAQYNIDRMLSSAEIALHYEDYQLSTEYSNQIIAVRPYLYKPWQIRGASRYYLGDYAGCEADATEALQRNPYVTSLYDLRAMSRIRQQKYAEAISDYTEGLSHNPSLRAFWYNRAICHLQLGHYAEADAQADTLMSHWSGFAEAYSLKAEVLLHKGDTVGALSHLQRGADVDPYNTKVLYTLANTQIESGNWQEAGLSFLRVVHLQPKHVPSRVSLALCRWHVGDTAGAIDEYTRALTYDPSNFLAHYNRGLIYASIGKKEQALADFNYVLTIEPANPLAQKNQSLLLEKSVDRRQWPTTTLQRLRLRADNNEERFASLVIDDQQYDAFDFNYQTEYRRRGNQRIGMEEKAMFLISHVPYSNGDQAYQAFDRDLERFIASGPTTHNLYVACGHRNVTSTVMRETFEAIDTLTQRISLLRDGREAERLFFQRAVAYSVVQNFPDAISDLNNVIMLNPNSAIAYWQRAVCQALLNGFNIAQGIDMRARTAGVVADFDRALQLAPENAYILYNRALLRAANEDIGGAIEDYTRAVVLQPNMAEAYFNRGILYLRQQDQASAVRDLRQALELGLREAQSILQGIN